MKKVKLGSSSLQVSEVCLGSMTWGEQNTQEDAFDQIEYALDRGINFIDTAEMYAVPPKAETCGFTETYIGDWIAANQSRRDEFVLATKIAGPKIPWVRDGGPINTSAINNAIDGSLGRLQTDYIDLYQIHWPNRMHPYFAKHWPGDVDYSRFDVQKERDGMLEILRTLDENIKAGKIRYCGVSNETPWGVGEYRQIADKHDLPKMVSVQNEFNLLNLMDVPHLMESCALNDMAFLPWSPLAGGALSGKYADGQIPEGCRWSMQQRHGILRDTPQVHEAIAAYKAVADKHGLTLVQLALAWVYQYSGVTSAIIGATSMEQLKADIDAYDVALSEEILAEVKLVIKRFPKPF